MLRMSLFVFFIGVVVTLLSSCAESGAGGPDMGPIGDGLRFIGVALVVAVLVLVFGSMRRGGGGPYG